MPGNDPETEDDRGAKPETEDDRGAKPDTEDARGGGDDPGIDDDPDAADDPETDDDPDADGENPLDRRVERTFTCTLCGYGMVHEVGPLRAEARGVCHNCGDWTVQSADEGVVIETAEEVAEALAGPILTERQALAYLLREVVGLDRERTAGAMDSTPSNVDNLRRRGQEKVEDARRILAGLDALGDGDATSSGTGPSPGDDRPTEG